MPALKPVAAALVERARVEEVAMLYASFNRTTLSMLLGALILCAALRDTVAPSMLAGWIGLVVLNQAWRGALARAWHRAQPGAAATRRWGRYWAIGSATAGALWGAASVAMFPDSAPRQALVIVCLFGVVLGGLYLTAVYKPAFYGFALPALVPLIVRVAAEGDAVHAHTALVMSVVLAFILAFGHRLNDLMTHALATRYENADLVAELKDQTRAAHAARAAAEAANRGKSQLLAAASHDLRQPLHALALFAAALAARTRDTELAPLVASVERSARSLDAQFDQLLDLSRLEANAFTPERRRVALAPLFARLEGEFAPHASARGLELRFAPTRASIETDPVLLPRILRNLIGNALRYTETGGVLIGARRVGARLAIDVFDTGPGIPPANRERIFDEFFQIDALAGAPQAGRGSGLGLAIVKRFAELLGHEVSVASRVGRGARFRVVCKRADSANRPAPRVVPIAAGPVRGLEGALVAVIDDDSSAIEGMRALFGAWGARVAAGSDAAGVLAALGALESYPDLIVADLRLATGTGIDAIARVRDELGAPLPALIVSGDVSPGATRDAREAGLALLRKPVDATALRIAATTFVAQSPFAAC
ncbi:MAG TPA: hybrid sensor histidine kinase/response regulator [Casimicrobiaceae bacterium]|jgi:signal transduction histidine kinase/CheY-like chemotaxis protein